MSDARPLYFVRLKVDPAREEEFNRWYHERHIPRLLQYVPTFKTARRYRAMPSVEDGPAADGKQWNYYLTVYELESADKVQEAITGLGVPERKPDHEEWVEWQPSLDDVSVMVFEQVYP